MPLPHLDDDYMIWRVFRRVTFWMADDKGGPVRCSVSNEALIERIASDAYDAGVLDEEGRVPVTINALERASRRA
jgi:hypothetical protein